MSPPGVSITAVLSAAARALESTRAGALIHDPWAVLLMNASGVSVTYPQKWPEHPASLTQDESMRLLKASYAALRARFVDDELLSHGIRQVCLVGDGLDTRPWRMEWPRGTTVHDIDSTWVLSFVDDVLNEAAATPHCVRVPVPVNFKGPWARTLIEHGFDPAEPAHWVIEHLLPNLGPDEQLEVVKDVIDLSAPGSRVVIEQAMPLADTPTQRDAIETLVRITGIPRRELRARIDAPDIAAMLAAQGWILHATTRRDLERRYSRPLQLNGVTLPDTLARGLITAELPRR